MLENSFKFTEPCYMNPVLLLIRVDKSIQLKWVKYQLYISCLLSSSYHHLDQVLLSLWDLSLFSHLLSLFKVSDTQANRHQPYRYVMKEVCISQIIFFIPRRSRRDIVLVLSAHSVHPHFLSIQNRISVSIGQI